MRNIVVRKTFFINAETTSSEDIPRIFIKTDIAFLNFLKYADN